MNPKKNSTKNEFFFEKMYQCSKFSYICAVKVCLKPLRH